MGDADAALGQLVRLWILGQKWYLTPSKMIPKPEWKKNLFSDAIIETGWAEDMGDFIRVCGAESQFVWLEQKVTAGRKGGEAKARNHSGKVLANSSETWRGLASSSSSSSKKNTTTTNPPVKPELKNQVTEAFEIWNQTLASFNIPKSPIAMVQENSISRAIGSLGFENVCLALEGQRFEKPNDTFRPREHLSVDRALHRDAKGNSRWEKFKNMALENRHRVESQKAAAADAEAMA